MEEDEWKGKKYKKNKKNRVCDVVKKLMALAHTALFHLLLLGWVGKAFRCCMNRYPVPRPSICSPLA